MGRCKQKQRGLRGLLCRWPSITEWEMYITAQRCSEMTYTVSSGTLNSSISYHTTTTTTTTTERSVLFGVVETVKRYWGNFRFLSGRKWITRQGFVDGFSIASRRWTRTSSYRSGIGRGTRDRREFRFRSRYFRFRLWCNP